MRTILLTILLLFTSQIFAEQDSIDLAGIEVTFEENLDDGMYRIPLSAFRRLSVLLSYNFLYDYSKHNEPGREERISEGEEKARELFEDLKSDNPNFISLIDTRVVGLTPSRV